MCMGKGRSTGRINRDDGVRLPHEYFIFFNLKRQEQLTLARDI